MQWDEHLSLLINKSVDWVFLTYMRKQHFWPTLFSSCRFSTVLQAWMSYPLNHLISRQKDISNSLDSNTMPWLSCWLRLEWHVTTMKAINLSRIKNNSVWHKKTCSWIIMCSTSVHWRSLTSTSGSSIIV